jgi:uncharacterized repeat protein (TIGR03803 family)
MKKFYITLLAFLSLGTAVTKAQYSVLHNFNDTAGASPYGALTLSGNKLFGMAYEGGLNGEGCIFSIDTNGGKYKDIMDFDDANGAYPFGSLTIAGNRLYGMTSEGGANYAGCVFSVDTNGNGYKELLDFNNLNGAQPGASLILSGKVLYGTTQIGGIHGQGNIFSIDTNGNGYNDLHDFSGYDGLYPICSLIISNGVMYGTTTNGGVNRDGNIFSIDTNGNVFKDVFDFNDTNGASPYSALSLLGNTLYGMANFGGMHNEGDIFEVNTNGSGFKDILDFDSANGGSPFGPLTLSRGVLYGITAKGGAHDSGCVFSIGINGSGYRDLVDFDSASGTFSHSSITVSGNILYGMNSRGGANSEGVIFAFKDTNFSCSNGFNQSICIVTTDTAINKNVIIWGRNNSPPDGSFNIYDSTSAGWTLIATVPDTSLSEYVDVASNPATQSYSYRISTIDSCGESALSSVNSSIYLQVLQGSNKDSLYWSAYVGFSAPIYYIYKGTALNKLTLIDSVSGSTLYYIDTLPVVGDIYMVEAVNPSGGCTPTHKHISPDHSSYINTNASFSNGGVPQKVTGITEVGPVENPLVVSPNPGNGVFNMNYTLVRDEEVTINVIDEFGRIVYEKQFYQHAGTSKQMIDIENLAEGIYSLLMITGEGVTVRKVVLVGNK